MLEISELAADILAGSSFTIHYRFSSWLAGECLAEDIPCVDPVEDLDIVQNVPERLSFRVPIEDDQGNVWVPTSVRSPLGWFGQRIHAQWGVGIDRDQVEWINRGVFLLHSAVPDGDDIAVDCLGLLNLVDEANLATEFQPGTGATFLSALRQLVEPGIPLNTADAPTDRAIPSTTVTWSESRLGNVFSILDAWPAQARIGQEGVLYVTEIPDEPTDADVVFEFDDTDTGTVVQWTTGGSREDGFNAVIMQGVYDDSRGNLAGLPIVQTVYDTDPVSPYNLLNEFSPYLVPRKFENPLLNEHTPVLLAASKKMVQLHRQASRTVKIRCVPHGALTLDDAVRVRSSRLALGLAGELGRITKIRLPYDAGAGDMEIDVRLNGFL